MLLLKMHWISIMKDNYIFDELRYAWKTRKVWTYTALARTRARFARTKLGGFWLGISNLLCIAVLAAIYGVVFKVDDFNEYAVYLGLGLVCWNSIASCFSAAPSLFEINSIQLLNTNTKHIFYTLEEWAFQSQTFLQSFFLVLIGLSFFQYNLFFNLLKIGFLPLLNLFLFLYWFPIFIAIIGLRYKDFYQLIPVVIQIVFLISPFLYKKEMLGKLSIITNFNPLYQIVSNIRDSLITGELYLTKFSLILLINIIGTYLSIYILKKSRKILPFLI